MNTKTYISTSFLITLAMLAITIFFAVSNHHNESEKMKWRNRWYAQHERFMEHVGCMKTGTCDAMKLMPMKPAQ